VSVVLISGWFRQCAIIPHSKDVDIGIWIKDYDIRLIPAMQTEGIPIRQQFGKVDIYLCILPKIYPTTG